MNLEALALLRAEEQIDAGTWKRASQRETDSESSAPRLCHVPGCSHPLPEVRGNRRTICDPCRDKGYAATPCKACGRRLYTWEQRLTAKERRGFCGACRAEMPQAYSRDMSAAHAELARRRAGERRDIASAIRNAENEALERAAQVVDGVECGSESTYAVLVEAAARIRRLKSKLEGRVA